MEKRNSQCEHGQPLEQTRGFYGYFMLFLSCFCYAFVRVCLYVPCGQLLGKG